MVSLAGQRIVSDYLQQTYTISERRSCRIIGINRSTKRNKPIANQDQEFRAEIHRLSERYPRFGYRKIYDKLKESGWCVGRERVRLIRKQEGLQVIKKQKKKRLLGKSTTELSKAKYPNHVWSYDLVSDQTACGRRLRCLTVIDEYTRYGLSIYTGRSITSGHIKRILSGLFEQWGPPDCIKSDNGPEFIAKKTRIGSRRSALRPITSIQAVPGRTATMKASMESFAMVAWTGGCSIQFRRQGVLSMPGSTNTILNDRMEPSLE